MKPSQPRLVISSSTSTTSITAVGCGPLPSPVTGETLPPSRQRWSSTRAATCTRPIPASGRSSVSTPLEEKHALVRCLAGRIAHHQTRQRTASTTAASESSAATGSSRRPAGGIAGKAEGSLGVALHKGWSRNPHWGAQCRASGPTGPDLLDRADPLAPRRPVNAPTHGSRPVVVPTLLHQG
jgi:hypothetical protein